MQDKIEEAAARFEEAVRVKADFAPAHYNLGLARERQARDDDAEARLTSLLQLKPDYPGAAGSLAELRARRGARSVVVR